MPGFSTSVAADKLSATFSGSRPRLAEEAESLFGSRVLDERPGGRRSRLASTTSLQLLDGNAMCADNRQGDIPGRRLCSILTEDASTDA